MLLDEMLKNVSIIGAAGKMGSGISLLVLQEMALLEAQRGAGAQSSASCLHLIDSNPQGFAPLRHYLKTHLVRYAEQRINILRQYYGRNPYLISNEEIVNAFADGALDMIRFGGDPVQAGGSSLVFEAIVEDIDAKVELYQKLASLQAPPKYYLSNTSSIPISFLSEKANLDGRIIGLHFYNPASVQKLVEVIQPVGVEPELLEIAEEFAKRCQKTLVYANDIAGFIGNGFFLREVEFACQKVEQLAERYGEAAAIYLVNRATQLHLLRPMGIFQLIDYVGLDVCWNIGNIMDIFLDSFNWKNKLIAQMIAEGLSGGISPDGSQKKGFFRYAYHAPDAVYSLKNHAYMPTTDMESLFGEAPAKSLQWKTLEKNPERQSLIAEHFKQLATTQGLGAQIARDFLVADKKISEQLVNEGVAKSPEDLATTLRLGFRHLYDPLDISAHSTTR